MAGHDEDRSNAIRKLLALDTLNDDKKTHSFHLWSSANGDLDTDTERAFGTPNDSYEEEAGPMSKNKYMTKYQLEHLKKRVSAEIDPIIEEAKLMRKSVVAGLTASAEDKLAKKIKADVVIKDLEKAFKNLETAQRKAKTFLLKA